MHLSVLLLALPAVLPTGWGLSDDLAALTAADAGARELATRRLCAELTLDQRPALMRLAEDADFELERRITRILAARDERLPIAIELFAGRSRRGRVIGRAAFLELLSRWSPSYAAAPIVGEQARSLLVDSQRGIIQVPRSVGGVVPILEGLDEAAYIGLPLVLDRGASQGVVQVLEPMLGEPLDVFEALCARHNLSYELRGLPADAARVEASAGHWIRVASAGDMAGVSSEDLLLSWSLRVERGGEDAPAAARALARTGWPAPLYWFSERWREQADTAALSGLLAAAAQGRVALVLTELETHSVIRDRLDQLAAGPPQGPVTREVERLARGMARASARSSEGAELSAVWKAEGENTSRLARLARLLILEGHRSGDCELTRLVLEEGPERDPELWLRALQAYASDPNHVKTELSLGELPALSQAERTEGLGRLLHRAGVQASELSDVRGVELLRAELRLREGGSCGGLLYEAWRSGVELEPLLVSWRVEFGRSRVARALGDAEVGEGQAEGWERLLELSGVLPPGVSGDVGDDLQRLACRAGGPSGAAVRGVLLEELADFDPLRLNELSIAWRRVAWTLQEAGEEEALRSFHVLTEEKLRGREDLQRLLKGFPPLPRGLSERLDVGLLSK